MDSRERVSLALDFQEADRVPVDFWGSSGFYRALKAKTGLGREEFLDVHDVDLRYIDGPRYTGPKSAAEVPGGDVDIWGVPRRSVTVPTPHGEEVYMEVARHPLASANSVDAVEAYRHWPSPDWFDYSPIAAQCAAVHDKGRVVAFMGDRLNRVAQLKPAMYLRGVEQIFLDLAESPEVAAAIFGRIRRFYREYLCRVLDAAAGGIDIVVTGDDFGAQTGPLVSPPMWRRFLAEGFRDYIEIIRSRGARSMHHTCGMVTPLVADLVACGLQVLQSLQPEAMAGDFRELKRSFGRRLAFQGGLSVQQTLPRGTPDAVREEVRRRVEVLAPGGGYILGTAHNVQADCPLENVAALLRAYRELGRYNGGAAR